MTTAFRFGTANPTSLFTVMKGCCTCCCQHLYRKAVTEDKYSIIVMYTTTVTQNKCTNCAWDTVKFTTSSMELYDTWTPNERDKHPCMHPVHDNFSKSCNNQCCKLHYCLLNHRLLHATLHFIISGESSHLIWSERYVHCGVCIDVLLWATMSMLKASWATSVVVWNDSSYCFNMQAHPFGA